jgi:molecular chaperone DnaK
LFTTVRDQQEEVIIHIMQREELGESCGQNHVSLGKFHLEGIQQAQAGEPNIFETFEIDRNGIFNVSALDLDTGRQNQVQITEVSYCSGSKVTAGRGKNLIVN